PPRRRGAAGRDPHGLRPPAGLTAGQVGSRGCRCHGERSGRQQGGCPMLRLARFLPFLLAVVLVPGCAFMNQRAATRVIADAEKAYAKIAQQAHSLAPDRAKAIEDGLASAKAKLTSNAAGALADARGAADKVRVLAEDLPGIQAKYDDEWKDLNATVPNAL